MELVKQLYLQIFSQFYNKTITPPWAPSSCIITATNKSDANQYKKAGQFNSVPFPTNNPDFEAEPNANSGGVPPMDEEAGEWELANIAHGKKPKTHKQAMASPDTEQWLAVECYELDQLTSP